MYLFLVTDRTFRPSHRLLDHSENMQLQQFSRCRTFTPHDVRTFHVVHLRIVPFNTLILSAASCLNVPLVPFPGWLSKISEEHKAQSDLDAKLERTRADSPALCLPSVYEWARTGPEWEPLGIARLDTVRAIQISKRIS